VAPFSSHSAALGEELPDWLLFSPSYLKGRSPALGHLSAAWPAASFTDVVKGKGKSPVDAKGQAPMDLTGPSEPQHGAGAGRRPLSEVEAVFGGFMADARWAPLSHAPSPIVGGCRDMATHYP
jgi:hypothetical protein